MRKIVIFCLKSAITFILIGALLSMLVVLIFRWAPVVTSGVMLERKITGSPSLTHHFTWRNWEHISPSAPLAMIAAEDQQFFQHHGFDFEQLQHALREKQQGKRLRGASTISQQMAKNLFLWSDRSYIRKALETWFTVLIEIFWPKQRVLEVYMNIVEFGPGIYGVEAASRRYFRKPAKHLGKYEAALLAAVLPNPHRMHVAKPSPYVRKRQRWIVKQMTQLGSVKSLQSLAKQPH